MPFSAAVAENRCTYRVISSASYRYAQPAHEAVTVLRLVPPDQRGLQRLESFDVQIAPLPYSTPKYDDPLGNRVIEARNEEVSQNLTIVVNMKVDTAARYDESGAIVPTPVHSPDIARDTDRFLATTQRTTPIPDMEQFASHIRREHNPDADGIAFADALRSGIHEYMTFRTGTTHVGTTAAEAWVGRRGVCQDFTHIALTISRLAGIPARYVSGFVPGEGVMHAWAEVLIAAAPGEDPAWYGIDPTYNKWVSERYVSVAVGRDYADCSPTSGTYYGGASTLRYGARMDPLRKDLVLL